MSETKSTPTPRITLSIGNPENYPSKSLDKLGKRKERVAYNVTGSASAIEMYNADMLARTNKLSTDDNTGNPLFTIGIEQFSKSGAQSTIVRSSKPDESGNYNWFLDTEEATLISKAMQNASPEIKQAHAEQEYSKTVASIKAMLASKRAKSVVVAEEKADLG